jgi:hypothetical protein
MNIAALLEVLIQLLGQASTVVATLKSVPEGGDVTDEQLQAVKDAYAQAKANLDKLLA